MSIREYTDSIINKLRRKSSEQNKKSNRKLNIYVAAGIISAVFGLGTITIAFPMGLACLGTAIAAVSGYKSTEKKKKIEKNIYEQEIQYLEKLKSTGIKVDRASKIERNNRYRTARTNIADMEENNNVAKARENITCGASIGTGILGLLMGGIFGYISPLVAGYKLITDKISKKDYNDYMNTKLELDNVTNELDIINYASTHRGSTRTFSSTLYPSKGKDKTNTKNYTKEQIDAANKYIDALSKVDTSKEEPKQIVKK